MPNLHIEHLEDTILDGNLSLLKSLLYEGNLSTKIDGAPAIVWGKHPQTQQFFVGTKSVFNKKLIKVNYTHDDIDNNHSGNVATILHTCLCKLPYTDDIYQGDFIGFGGESSYTPNTITYQFDHEIQESIIVAPHTIYVSVDDNEGHENVLRNCEPIPLYENLECNEDVLFIKPECKIDQKSVITKINFALQMSQLVDFPDKKEALIYKKEMNYCIRENELIDPEDYDNERLISLWILVKEIKDELVYSAWNNGAGAYIEDEYIGAEGYVFNSGFGSVKLVSREDFSYKNFTLEKNWQ